MTRFTESIVEQAALARLENLGWRIEHGTDISPDDESPTLAFFRKERNRYSEVVLGDETLRGIARELVETGSLRGQTSTIHFGKIRDAFAM